MQAEPGPKEVWDLVKSIDFIDTRSEKNSEHRGILWNPFVAVERAFRDGSSFNFFLEDDVVISPDAIDLTNWFIKNGSKYSLLHLFNLETDPSKPDELEEHAGFAPYGWGISSNNWRNMIRNEWHDHLGGWDFSVYKLIKDHTIPLSLRPRFSRSNHIGRIGHYCTSERWDKVYKDHVYNQEFVIKNFRIT